MIVHFFALELIKQTMHFNKFVQFLILTFLPLICFAQEENTGLASAVLVNFEFGFNMPGGDYGKRFGNNLGLGGGVEYMTKKNFVYGLNGTFYFGDKVKEDVLSNIVNDEGFLIGNNKIHANLFLRQRAFYIGGSAGKLFALSQFNKRSGIRVNLGAGLFQHKIRIEEDANSFVPIVSGDYKKGWDRMSNGLSLRQFIGYQHLSTNGLVNFYLGLEFVQAFTQNQRLQDYKLMQKLDENRFDMMYGIKLGWTLPFAIGVSGDSIFY